MSGYECKAYACVRREEETQGRIRELADRIDNLTASGVHSCGTRCKRPMCVLRREKDAAEAALKEARILLTTARLFIPAGQKLRSKIDAFLTRTSKDTQP